MKLLLATHLLQWVAGAPDRLPAAARDLLNASRDDFQVEPRLLRRGLIDNGYQELAITSEHAIAVGPLSRRPVR